MNICCCLFLELRCRSDQMLSPHELVLQVLLSRSKVNQNTNGSHSDVVQISMWTFGSWESWSLSLHLALVASQLLGSCEWGQWTGTVHWMWIGIPQKVQTKHSIQFIMYRVYTCIYSVWERHRLIHYPNENKHDRKCIDGWYNMLLHWKGCIPTFWSRFGVPSLKTPYWLLLALH